MKKFFAFLAVSLFLITNVVSAQKLTPQQQQELNKLYKTKKVVYFKFNVKNSMQEVSELAKIISVDRTKGMEVYAHATKEQFTKFSPFNYRYIVTAAPQKKKSAPAKK